MKQFLLLFYLIPVLVNAQLTIHEKKEADPYKMEISKDIFRVNLSLATDAKFSPHAAYERELFRPFTLLLKAGPAFDRDYLFTDIWGNEQYKWFLNFAASGELRYYFSLGRRIKHEKTVKNFSGPYLSLEEAVWSKPLIILNKTGDEVLKGSYGTFINLGYQKQVGLTYYNIFFGTKFPGKIYEQSTDAFDIIHAGIGIGRVF